MHNNLEEEYKLSILKTEEFISCRQAKDIVSFLEEEGRYYIQDAFLRFSCANIIDVLKEKIEIGVIYFEDGDIYTENDIKKDLSGICEHIINNIYSISVSLEPSERISKENRKYVETLSYASHISKAIGL